MYFPPVETGNKKLGLMQFPPVDTQVVKDVGNPIQQTSDSLIGGLKKLGWDIKANLTGKEQKPEDQGILNRTFGRFGEAGQKIGEAINETGLSDIPGALNPLVPSDQKKKIFTAGSKAITGTLGDLIGSGFQTLATKEGEASAQDVLQSEPVKWAIDKGKELLDKIPNETDREFVKEAINWIPIPVLDDLFKGAGTGLKFVPEGGLTLEQGLKTGAENIGTGIKTVGETIGKPFENIPAKAKNLSNAVVEKTVATQWKLPPSIKRDIRKNTGTSAEKFALDNDLVGQNMDDSIARTEDFKTNKINQKIQEVSKWGEVDKSPAQIEMAKSLKENLERSLSKDADGNITAGNDPELIKLLDGVDKFIENPKSTYDQVDALKSLYDHYNPDNLSWDTQGRLVNPTAHQNAAFRRSEVQKLIEDEGAKRGVDIKKLNKDIQGSHDLIRGLTRREEVMANNNIISLGDTQIAILGSVLGGDISGLGLLLAKKGLGAEATTGFLSRKLYNRPNEANSVSNLSPTPPVSRVDRFNPPSNAGGDISGVKKIIIKSPGEGINGQQLVQALKQGKIDIKEAIKRLKDLSPEDIAKSPELQKLVEVKGIVDDVAKIQNKYGRLPQKEIANTIDNIENGDFTEAQKDYMYSELPAPVKKQVQEINFARDYPEEVEVKGKSTTNEEAPNVPEGTPKLGEVTKEQVLKEVNTETPPEAPTTTETIEEVVSTPEVTETPLLRKKDVFEGKYDFNEVASRYMEDIANEKPGAIAKVVDSDVLKKMFAEYDPKDPGLVHEESKILADKIFQKFLKEDKSGEVVFSAGGPASGKTEGVVSRYLDRDNIIYDHLLSSFDTFKKKYKQAIDAGKKVKVHAIYTDIDTAKAYNKARGREVPDIEQKHKSFRQSLADLIKSKEYKEGNIDLQVSINTPLGNVLVDKTKIASFVRKFKDRLDI